MRGAYRFGLGKENRKALNSLNKCMRIISRSSRNNQSTKKEMK